MFFKIINLKEYNAKMCLHVLCIMHYRPQFTYKNFERNVPHVLFFNYLPCSQITWVDGNQVVIKENVNSIVELLPDEQRYRTRYVSTYVTKLHLS